MITTPAHKFKIGLVTATIWENDGFHSVDLQRAYKTREGDWKSSGSFGQSDLLNAAKCAERAEARDRPGDPVSAERGLLMAAAAA